MVTVVAIFVSTIVGFIIFLSVTLNLLVLYVFIKRYNKIEFVHAVLMSIAVSDILMSTIGFVPEAISTINRNFLNESNIVCLTSGFIIFGLAISIIAHISMFNLIRTIAIIYPIYYRSLFKNKVLRYFLLFLCHAYGLAWAAFPFFSWSTYKLDLDGRRCSIDWKLLHPKSLSYVISVIVFCYFVPGLLVTFSILWGKTGLKRNKNSIARRSTNVSRRSTKKVLEDNLVRLFIVMATMFFISWTPYALTGLLAVCNKSPPDTFVTISAFFAKMASVSNPIINCFINKNFRKKLLKTKWIRNALQRLVVFKFCCDDLSKRDEEFMTSRQTSEFLKLSRDQSSIKMLTSVKSVADTKIEAEKLKNNENETINTEYEIAIKENVTVNNENAV